MFFGTLDHLKQYEKELPPAIMEGLKFLAEADFSQYADGDHHIKGDDMFLKVQSYTTKEENLTPESHRRYVDIQFLVSGAEKIGVAPIEDMKEVVSENVEQDLWLHHGPVEYLTVTGKRFLILWPEDAHAPCVAVDSPEPIRKCLVKVKI